MLLFIPDCFHRDSVHSQHLYRRNISVIPYLLIACVLRSAPSVAVDRVRIYSKFTVRLGLVMRPLKSLEWSFDHRKL